MVYTVVALLSSDDEVSVTRKVLASLHLQPPNRERNVVEQSSEIAICCRRRLEVSVGNFQRVKHEMFIFALSGIMIPWWDRSG